MRQITKTVPPNEFEEFCKMPGATYDTLSGNPKKALRKRLLEDQGYICCYCGRRIQNDHHTKIEHIKCQENYGHLALDFNNMLASCDGGDMDRQKKVKPTHQLHCDAKKGDNDIPISPLEDIEELLIFFDDGTVKGKDSIGRELIRLLGLDAKYLDSQRRNAIRNYEILPPDDLDLELALLKHKKDGCLIEFCFVLEQYIKNLIKDRDHLE